MDYYKGTIPIIDDSPSSMAYALPNKINGITVGYGLTPRNYKDYPEDMFPGPQKVFAGLGGPKTEAAPDGIKVYEESEWDALYEEQEQLKSSLEHLFLRGGQPAFVNLDQNGHGYCWCYSTGSSIMMERLAMNDETVRLNPHSVAAIIKNGRDEGGWCGLSQEFAAKNGMAEEGDGPGQWPLHSRDIRYDTPELRQSMLKYKVTKQVVDLTKGVYDRNLSTKLIATLHFRNVPIPQDFNWQSHSVCGIRWVRVEPGSWGVLILNSWKGWGRFGLAVYRGRQGRADGAVATLATAA